MGLKPIKVSQVNNYIKRILNSDPVLKNITVIGEVSNLKYHSTGNVYFSLKDETSKINCFLPAGLQDIFDFALEDGQKLVVAGYINVYERGGTYTLIIKDIRIEGEGDLNKAFVFLKNKLKEEGLFDKSRPLPLFPSKIAIITSPTGAAVEDIVKTIKNKNTFTDILIYPVLVQGQGASRDIAAAIEDINKNLIDIEVIILARGGGSIEELWAFNEELTARAIYGSHVPVISAVGHETDFTIADFVADVRAETPTAGANMAVPDSTDIAMRVDQARESLSDELNYRYKDYSNKLNALQMEKLLDILRIKLDFFQMKSNGYVDQILTRGSKKYQNCKNKLDSKMSELKAMDPKLVLKRGYSILVDSNNRIISKIEDLEKNHDIIHGVVSDGKLILRLEGIEENEI